MAHDSARNIRITQEDGIKFLVSRPFSLANSGVKNVTK